MSELPKGWASAPLSELVTFNPKHDASKKDEIVSFVPMPAVDAASGTIQGATERPLADVWKGFTHFAENDVIFAKITPCMENGKIAVAQGLTNGMACGSTEFHVLRSDGAVLPKFIWRFLRQATFRKDAESAMTGAVGQRRVPTDYLKSTELPLPPLPEQRRIVEKLDALTARTARARADLDRIPALAARYKQAVLAKAFSGELTADWRAANSQLALTNEEQDAARKEAWSVLSKRRGKYASAQTLDWKPSKLSIPDTWRWSSIDELSSSVQYGSSAKTSDDPAIPVLRMGNIVDGKLDYEKLKYLPEGHDEFPDLLLDDGDLLFNRTNSPELVGKTAVFRSIGQPVSFASYLIRLKMVNVVPELIAAYVNSSYGRDWVLGSVSQQVGQANVNGTKLRGLGVPLMPLDEQVIAWHRIQSAFVDIDRMVTEAAASRRLLDRLDQAILAKAFRGELVPQDPSDEPASVLLDRIRAERANAPKATRGRRKATAA